MNVIFAFIFAMIAYGMGVPYQPSIVSETMPGSPAWRAGIQPGDEIVQIGDVVNPTFMQLRGSVTLGDRENGVNCIVRRAADGEEVRIPLKPRQEQGQLATIGVVPPQSLTLREYRTESGELRPVLDDSPAARAVLVAPSVDAVGQENARFLKGDKIVRVGDVPVVDYREFARELARQPEAAIKITVERKQTGDGKKARDNDGAANADKVQELTFEVPTQPLQQLGLVMKIGPIRGVQADSPAAKAGLTNDHVGDVIETVDGEPVTIPSRDPSLLPNYFRVSASEGQTVEMGIVHPVEDGAEPVSKTVQIKPQVPNTFHQFVPEGVPMGLPSAGLAYEIGNKVVGITPGGPAAASEIAPGDVITAAKVVYPKDGKGETTKPLTVKFVADKPKGLAALVQRLFGSAESEPQTFPNWPSLLDQVQFIPAGTKVELAIQRGKEEKTRTVTVTPAPTDGAFFAARGFVFEPVERIRTATTFAEAAKLGWGETVEALTLVVRFLQKLGTQVPITMLGGPGTIAAAAGGAASQGWSSLLIFLTMLSANLAVINFLPIPLLDGGHMVFLAYEGLRGRPANERVVVALHTVGFVFIISLMLFVIGLDIQRWIAV
jgi:regulator of sigma E protease